MPKTVHWYLDGKKNTTHVNSAGDPPNEMLTITVDVPGQRANTCTVPRSFFREVADKLDTPPAPEAA